ncbi:MAG: aminotransferase class I/II-fold pyridoxal phosphate-dependent enzyme [Spirochaetales bacterium]|nr:aminotransferase class I/II-fold pyridoxal phosphate-dependent enzyme [Spirochaetales bacterium]
MDQASRIIIQPPVYGAFKKIINNSGNHVVYNYMLEQDDVYAIDFDNLKDTLSKQKVSALIFCNPHNPTGNVWSYADINQLASILNEKNVMLLCDEIFADLVYTPYRFVSILNLKEDDLSNVIIFNSVSKSFNLPGLVGSYAIIPNEVVRQKITRTI